MCGGAGCNTYLRHVRIANPLAVAAVAQEPLLARRADGVIVTAVREGESADPVTMARLERRQERMRRIVEDKARRAVQNKAREEGEEAEASAEAEARAEVKAEPAGTGA